MRFENHFDVDAPLDRVWDAILDVERVAPTVPGAKVLERTGDDAYDVSIKVRVGPMSITYRGQVEIVERDQEAHRAVMRARAKETRGQGTADADVTMLLAGEDGRTSATITTEVDISGKVATMGQGVLQDVSGRLVETFARNLATMLEGGPEEAAEAVPEAEPAKEPAAAGAEDELRTKPSSIAEEERLRAKPSSIEDARRRAAPSSLRAAPAPQEEALDLGSMGGAMLAERLRDPRRLGVVLGVLALIAYLMGRRAGSRG